jgi:mercuric ion transport protein
MTVRDEAKRPTREAYAPGERSAGARLLSAGGILAGLAAASCCVIPFALFAAGVSGAWIANLTALEPYRPYFTATAIACIAYGFYRVYRKPAVACADGGYCARPGSDRIAKIGLWSATAIVLLALVSPYLIAQWL